MSKLKATKSGKAGKHKGQDTFSTLFMRDLRIGRVISRTEQRLLDLILLGSNKEQEDALAGIQTAELKGSEQMIVSAATPAATS